MAERLQGEERTHMQAAIQARLRAMSDVPVCHCGCAVWSHEIEAEMRAGVAVVLVEGHPANYNWRCDCSGYTHNKDGFAGVLQDVARSLQATWFGKT